MIKQYLAILASDPNGVDYGESTSFFKRLLSYAHRLGLPIYVFSVSDIDFDNETINGSYFEAGELKKNKFPFPTFIYDRSFQVKNRGFYYNKLSESGAVFLNDGSLVSLSIDKWAVYDLFRYKESPYFVCPKTELYPSNNLESLLSSYKKLIFKPRFGSGGRGIFFVEKVDNDQYQLSLNNEIYSFKDLLAYFEQINLSNYLIQEMIDIKKYHNRVFDIRVLLQKNGLGKLEIGGAVARVAAPQEIRANLHQGGEALPLEDLFAELYDSDYYEKVFKEKLYKASEEIFSLMAAQTTGEIIELALDFILDESGELFFIESGAKPGRRAFRALGKKIHNRTLQLPIDYMLFLLESKNKN